MKKNNLHLRLLAPLIFLLSFNSFTQTISFLTVPQSQNDTVSICEGNTITFTDNSQSIPAGATYNWSFPGGSPATAAGVGPHTVEYSTGGNYVAVLDVDGDVDTLLINVIESQPILNPTNQAWGTLNINNQSYFTLCESPGQGGPFFFETISTNTNGSTIHNIDWGDGSPNTTFTGVNTSSTQNYLNDGLYNITYTITTDNGCQFTEVFNVFIGAPPLSNC